MNYYITEFYKTIFYNVKIVRMENFCKGYTEF